MKDLDGKDIRCVFEGKVCYTEREAGIVMNNAKRHHYGIDDKRGKNIPKRKYFCKKCGFYHLTHYTYFGKTNKAKYYELKFYDLYS